MSEPETRVVGKLSELIEAAEAYDDAPREGEFTTRQIAEAWGRETSDARKILKRMEADGKVRCRRIRNDTIRLWTMAE